MITFSPFYLISTYIFNGPFIIFAVFTLVLKYFVDEVISSKKPPGPYGIPIIGSTPWLNLQIPQQVHQLSLKYGPIFSVRTQGNLTVFLNDAPTIKEALWKKELSGRPNTFISKIIEGFGIVNTVGERWKKARRTVHKHLVKLVVNGQIPDGGKLESKIMEDLIPLMGELRAHRGSPIASDDLVRHFVNNFLHNILMAEKYGRNHPFQQKIEELHAEGFRLYSEAGKYFLFPLMTLMSGFKKALRRLQDNRNLELSLFREVIEQRRKNFNPDDQITSLLDSYLKSERDGYFLENRCVTQYETDTQFCQILLDLYSGGGESVVLAVQWAFGLLLHNQDVVEKIQEELDGVVTRRRLVSLNDKKHLPFTQATVYETLRLGEVSGLAPPHSALSDIHVSGYLIPKGSTVIANIYTCHRDTKLWDSPYQFKPERFIRADGSVHKPEGFLPFGIGKRMCVAEFAARQMMFLIISNFLHVFNLSTDGPLPQIETGATLLGVNQRFKLQFIERQEKVQQLEEQHFYTA